MPLPVIANVYRVAFSWGSSSGQHAVNVLHVRKASSTASAVATAITAAVTANMWAPVSLSASINQMAITPLDGSSATLIQSVSGTIWTGGQGGDFIPQASALVSLRTTLRGKSKRGRVFLPFLGEAAQANGSLVSTIVTAGQTGWTNFVTTLAASVTDLVVASYLLSSAQNVSNANVESLIGTQRRRMQRLR